MHLPNVCVILKNICLNSVVGHFINGIDICIENVHIQKWSGVKSAEDDLVLLSMDDGMYYLFDLNNKIIRKYDDYSKLPDILKNDV